MGRAPCCDKANVKKGPWSPEEDAKLKSYIDQHGTGGNWIALPQKIGLKRCGKSCRLRWLNYLRPNIKHGGFSEEEDNIICSLYISIGSRWSIIAAQLPGRTDNDIKNYWNTRLKKKLIGKQRKEKKGGREKESSKGKQNSSLNYRNPAPPPPLPVLQPIPYSDEEPRFNNHASIRRLLIKLGGRFSSEDDFGGGGGNNLKSDHQFAAVDDQALLHQSVYNDPIHNLTSSSHNQIALPALPNEAHFDLVGSSDMSAALPTPSVMYEINPQRLQGLEFFYDDMMNWGDQMNPNWDANYQGFGQEWVSEAFAVDKLMRYSST